jgi:hypothetical protein
MLFIPLYPKFPSIRIPGIYVSIRLEDFLIFITLLLFVPILLNKRKDIIKESASKSIFVYLFVGFVSLLSAIFLTKTVDPLIGSLHLLRRVEYFSLFFVGFAYIRYIVQDKEKFLNYVLKLFIIIVYLIFAYGIGQRFLNFPVIITQNEEYSKGIALRWVPGAHINSTFGGHYDLASYIILIGPVLVMYLVTVKQKISKLVLMIAVYFCFMLLSFAVSRISIVAFIVACLLPLIIYKKYKESIFFIFVSLLIFGLSSGLRVRYERIFQVVKDKISMVNIVYAEEGIAQEDRSTSIRLNVEWPRAIRAMNKNLLLGTGYSSITLATDNDYLRALGEVGILGFLAFILILINFFKILYQKATIGISNFLLFKYSLLGSFTGLLLVAMFIDIFEASKFALNFWLMLGLIAGVNEYEQNI